MHNQSLTFNYIKTLASNSNDSVRRAHLGALANLNLIFFSFYPRSLDFTLMVLSSLRILLINYLSIVYFERLKTHIFKGCFYDNAAV